jgi:hypothetical protein
MRKLNEINAEIERQIDYHENNRDYSDNYMDFIGDTMQYDGIFSEEEIYRLMDADLYTDTDYSYMRDDAIAVYSVGDIEIQIETDLTQKEYKVIADKLYYASSYGNGSILVYICAGMNIRVYENKGEVI